MNRFLIITLIAFALTACVKDNLGDIPTEKTPSSKIHNWDESAAKGRLMVRLAEGVESFDTEGIALNIEPMFPATRSEKLNRWRLVRFDENLDLRTVAEAIALNKGVERVEYDIKLHRIVGKAEPAPASRPEPTRSQEMPFDDPELLWQWHTHCS